MKVAEKARQYAESKCGEEIGSKFIPETNLTVYDACELDFKNGYEQALQDVNVDELIEALKTTLEELQNISVLKQHCKYLNKLIQKITDNE